VLFYSLFENQNLKNVSNLQETIILKNKQKKLFFVKFGCFFSIFMVVEMVKMVAFSFSLVRFGGNLSFEPFNCFKIINQNALLPSKGKDGFLF